VSQSPQVTVFGKHGMNCLGRISSTITSLVTESSFTCCSRWSEDMKWRQDVNELFLPGSLGDASECDSYGSSEGLSSHQGNNKLPIRPTQTSLGVLECRPHLPVTRSSSGHHDQREQRQPESSLHQSLSGQSGVISSDNLAQRTGCPACPLLTDSTDSLSPLRCSGPLRET